MDLLREQLTYKSTPVHACMKSLTRREQYECIRVLASTRTQHVVICPHGATNAYVDTLLAAMGVAVRYCDLGT